MTQPLLFGKLPAHGDFVARGLSVEDRQRTDDWLSASLAEARMRYAAEFDDRYDRTPPWRFVHRCTGKGCAGVLVPSVDAAGRRFPLLIGVDAIPVELGGRVAAHCEAMVYAAFEQRWDADGLLAALASPRTGVDAPGGGEPPDDWWAGDEHGFVVARCSGYRPMTLLSSMLAATGGETA